MPVPNALVLKCRASASQVVELSVEGLSGSVRGWWGMRLLFVLIFRRDAILLQVAGRCMKGWVWRSDRVAVREKRDDAMFELDLTSGITEEGGRGWLGAGGDMCFKRCRGRREEAQHGRHG